MKEKTRASAIKVLPGVSIYQVQNSPYWFVRVWNRQTKKYAVKSTGQTSQILARQAAQELAVALLGDRQAVDRNFQFQTYCDRLLKKEQAITAKGDRSVGSFKAMKWCIQNPDWGLIITHRKNVMRLINGTESKISFKKKK